jgi:hypothetical protein
MSRPIYGVDVKNGAIVQPPCKYTPAFEKDINRYIVRLNNILTQLDSLRDPELAIERIVVLETELGITLNKPPQSY